MLRVSSVSGVRYLVAAAVVLGLSFAGSSEAGAAKKRRTPAWDGGKYAAIVIDANSDKVLFAENADSVRYPASLTKMMTLYVLFDDLKAGRIKKDTRMSASARAAAQAPSKLGLKPGDTITVDEAIRALVTKSANDVAVIVAEHIAGSESAFAERMTQTARRIGMTKTKFVNASGLPDDAQRTTARDLSILARALYRDHSDHYAYFSTSSFSYKGRTFRNHNRLLGRVTGVDGIKTGYINASGFNLTTSARRGKRHLVAVVMGGPTASMRDSRMRTLLDRHFAKGSTIASWQKSAPQPQLIARVPVPATRPYVATQEPDVAQIASLPTESKAPEVKPTVLTPAPQAAQTVPQPPAPLASPLAVAVALPPKYGERVPTASDLQPSTLDDQRNGLVAKADGNQSISAPKGLTVLVRKPGGRRPILASLTPNAAPSPVLQRQQSATTLLEAQTASTAPAPAAPAGGKLNDTVADLIAEKLQDLWLIQIGAFDQEAAAKEKLRQAQQEAEALKSRLAYTEIVQKDDLTLYRARFMGFDRESAQAACVELKKAKFKCLAMRQ